ncbi:PC4/YdbC family ssDNA-binding protein [Peribacillus psychrosaccharolyticus]|uniref:YdbC family protein n=1 Tax=Peribacillus psychrosaccharolyticus TaxID=1407 RepID=UPI003D29A1F0
MAEIKFEIIEKVAVLSESTKGWKKELNLISWNGREPKYDLREWAPDHEKMGKGITLSKEEIIELKKGLNNLDGIE